MRSMREALVHPSSWINEPTSSIRFDGKGDLIPSPVDDNFLEANNALPTIQSIPELVNSSGYPELTESLLNAFGADSKHKKPSKYDISRRQDAEPPSRRSSTVSVKAMFSPMNSDSETIVIRRSSAPARSRVDQGLQDVISQPCLTARLYASSREELLFQAPKVNRAGFVRSHSALTITGMAKSRLTRHESVRVLRRKSLVDGSDAVLPKKATSTGQTISTRRHTNNLSITALSEYDTKSFNWNSDTLSTSPTPLSPNYSMTASTPGSTSGSPTSRPILLGTSPSSPKSEPKSPLKPSRSLVVNVKGLFYSRSSSPVPLSVLLPNQPSEVEPQAQKTVTPGSIKRWAKGSLHRRARSAPDVAEEALLPLPISSEVRKLPGLNVEPPISVSRSSDTIFDPRIARRLSSTKSTRRKSLLSPSAFRCSSPEMDSTHRSTTKNISLLQRLKA
jgi:hypothetical protein